jgi:hypothetical protein
MGINPTRSTRLGKLENLTLLLFDAIQSIDAALVDIRTNVLHDDNRRQRASICAVGEVAELA